MRSVAIAVAVLCLPCCHATPLMAGDISACPFASQHGLVTNDKPPPQFPGPGVPDLGTQTVQGCTCVSQCGASVLVGNAECDFCWVDGECGHRAPVTGKHFDFCIYPVNQTFEDQDWQTKDAYLWGELYDTKDQRGSFSTNVFGTYPNIIAGLGLSTATAFDDTWDVMPAGRPKYVHSVGSVCKVNMVVDSISEFSGIFEPGTQSGIVRLGTSTPFNETRGITPGMALKFMRSGVPSANVLVAADLGINPNASYNYFGPVQSNHLPTKPLTPPANNKTAVEILFKEFKAKTEQPTNCTTFGGLSNAASWSQNGTPATNTKFPFEIKFRPTGQVAFPSEPVTLDGLLAEFAAIPVGTVLFDVLASSSPATRSTLTKIGTLATTSECTTSLFGDEKLYFRHQRPEEDWAIEPSWLDAIDPTSDCGVPGPLSLDPWPKCSERA